MNLPLSEIIKGRRSIREFTSEAIDIETIQTIIDTASHAPSNNNRQGWLFVAVTDKHLIQTMCGLVTKKLSESKNKSQTLDDLMEDYQSHFTVFKNAPVILVCCHVKPARFSFRLFDTDEENRHFTGELISVSLAMQNILLVSESMGLGTLVMTAPLIAAREIKDLVKIPSKYTIAAFICMGRFKRKPDPPRHKPVTDILIIKNGTGETD